ncbi:MAG: hypothetical protein JNL88_06980, partial [Bacteroidia bacterium]|nr:hypothetical protein [Bacteroidia bacterium]
MTKLADTFSNVRRTALILTPQKSFYDWVKNLDPSDKDIDPWGEPDVYLLPDFETTEEMERWLQRNFDWLFCEQLNNWYTDERLWPSKRTFKLFKEWFGYSLHTMVWDSVAGPIDK